MLAHNLSANLTADPSFQPADREDQMVRAGIARHRARQDRLADRGTASDRDDYASVIRQSLLGVADRIAAALDKSPKRTGPKSKLLLKINSIEESKEGYRGVTVAYITLSTLFNSLVETNDKAKIATSIGTQLNNEARFHYVSQTQPQAWKRLVSHAKERGSARHQTRFIFNTAAKAEIDTGEEWEFKDKTLLGEWLLGLIEEAELITIRSETVKGRTRSEILIQDHVLAWLEEYREKADAGSLPMITPLYAPMTMPPRDWSTPFNGGYETLRCRLVSRGLADYRAADMSRVYQAVNHMQRTAWRIHPGMLELITRLWSEGTKVGKLPLGVQQVVPDRVPAEDWEQMAPDERKARALELRSIHNQNRQAASDQITVNMMLAQARELVDEPEIYMPYYLDFRGRAYCQPLLNPQSAGFTRSMLEFAHGKPLGERGAMWLAIQVASLWDGEYRGKRLSKSSFQDRYDWAVENEELLRSVVESPMVDNRWTNADKPFLFLRSAIDWVGFLDEGVDFVSHVPVSLDGSCSGIQHYAALLRDAEVGARVNLVPSDEPADVYGDVADVVRPMVEAEAGSEAADFWIAHGITRKVVKRPTMTYGYSSREAGFTNVYNTEFVLPKLKRYDDNLSRYLAKKTLEAVQQILPAVETGMRWLQECARLLAHEGKGVEWTAPSGFPVIQREMDVPAIRVETELGGERIRVSIPGASKTVHKLKQKNGISPNHTHSLDAAHLVLTVLQAHEYGITAFSLIHDSFGTLAADTDAMFSAVREAFLDMYEAHDPFQHLYEQAQVALSEEGRRKLPPPPAKGDLDLSQILYSDYAFA
jgi:DNA-directed RNA polymerase